jgi:ankyrin repeat protein
MSSVYSNSTNHGARTDLEDLDGNTPLHVSANHDQAHAVEALLPACYDDRSHSGVESVNEHYFLSSSFYGE